MFNFIKQAGQQDSVLDSPLPASPVDTLQWQSLSALSKILNDRVPEFSTLPSKDKDYLLFRLADNPEELKGFLEKKDQDFASLPEDKKGLIIKRLSSDVRGRYFEKIVKERDILEDTLLANALFKDPDFALLPKEKRENVLNKLAKDPKLLIKVLSERTEEFRQLSNKERIFYVHSLIKDYRKAFKLKAGEKFDALEDPIIDPVDIATAAGVGAKMAVTGTKVLSGVNAALGEAATQPFLDRVINAIYDSNAPTSAKVAASIVLPFLFGAASAKLIEAPILKAAKTVQDKNAIKDLRTAIRRAEKGEATLEDLEEVVAKTLENKNVSQEVKEEILALPQYNQYNFELVPEGFRRDLPVPSKAVPMPEDVSEINRLARDFVGWDKKDQKALPSLAIEQPGEVVEDLNKIDVIKSDIIKPPIKTQSIEESPIPVAPTPNKASTLETLETLDDIADAKGVQVPSRTEVKKYKLYPMLGNKEQLLSNPAYFSIFRDGVLSSNRVIDAFMGTGLNSNVIPLITKEKKSIIKNEFNKFRYLTYKTLKEDPDKIIDDVRGHIDNVKALLKKHQDDPKKAGAIINNYLRSKLNSNDPAAYVVAQHLIINNIPINTSKDARVFVLKDGKIKGLPSLRKDLIVPKLKNIAKILREYPHDIRNGDAWELVEKEARRGDFVIFDPDYIAENGRQVAGYGKKSKEDKSLSNFLKKFDRIVLPKAKNGVKFLVTNTWDDNLAQALRERGFVVQKIQRRSRKSVKQELVATNYTRLGGGLYPVYDNPNVRRGPGETGQGVYARGVQENLGSNVVKPEGAVGGAGGSSLSTEVRSGGRGGRGLDSPTELYSGLDIPRAVFYADEVASKAIKTALRKLSGFKTLKKAGQILKGFSDPLPRLGEEGKDAFYSSLYGKYRPKEAEGAILSKEVRQTIDKILKNKAANEKKGTEVLIRYFEDPEFRAAARQVDGFKDVTGELDHIVAEIDKTSEELYRRGLITKSQREKWQGRYLARLYLQDKLSGVSGLSGIVEQKIYKGRKIESIMDLTKEERDALGYIEDPASAVSLTLSRNYHTIAADDFYRELIKEPEIVPQNFLVENPFAKQFKGLPEKASPKYIQEKVVPWLKEEIGDTPEVRALEQQAKEKQFLIERIKDKLPSDYLMLSGEDVKYGVLTGLPIQKDVGLQVLGIWRMTNEPDTLLKKIDSAASALYSIFKVMKVPLNLRAYPRNFISNIFQFMEVGNPARYIKEIPKTVKGIVKKDKYYQEALKMGLLGENFAKREIIDILGKIQGKTTRKVLDAFSKVSQPYGWIDDFAKLNTYRIMRQKGKSPLEAVKIAQKVHYDYGLVPYWVNQVRSTSMSGGGFVGKLTFSPFITFQNKAAGQLGRLLLEKPATSLALASSFVVLKNAIENYYSKKYGKKYEAGERLRPSYLDDPMVVHILTKDGKHRFVDITQIVPWAWLVKATTEASKGDITGALTEGGFGSSVFNVVGELKSGKDFFTGKPIYSPLVQTPYGKGSQKIKESLAYMGKKLLAPSTLEQIQTWRTSRHPVALRWLTGTNIYDYTTKDLANMAEYSWRDIENKARNQRNIYISQYRKGIIDKKELEEKLKELSEEVGRQRKRLFHIE